MKRITVWNGHTQLIFAFSDFSWPNVLSFSERLVYNGHQAITGTNLDSMHWLNLNI